jgi:hypothetical protein
MNRAQEHLAQANGHIAELTVQIVRQHVIVKYALDTGQRSEIVESLLDALEGSLRIFEKHRELILAQLQRPQSVTTLADAVVNGLTRHAASNNHARMGVMAVLPDARHVWREVLRSTPAPSNM